MSGRETWQRPQVAVSGRFPARFLPRRLVPDGGRAQEGAGPAQKASSGSWGDVLCPPPTWVGEGWCDALGKVTSPCQTLPFPSHPSFSEPPILSLGAAGAGWGLLGPCLLAGSESRSGQTGPEARAADTAAL